ALIQRLPNAALAALVFVIGVRLVDIRSLREIFHFRKRTFVVASAALLAVVFLGVERGIFLAVGLSILDHMEQEYHPKDVIMTLHDGRWKATTAQVGVETEPGLLVYRFQAPLFFANVDFFAAQLHKLLKGAPHPVKWLVLDVVSMSDIDYTAGLTLRATIKQFQQQGVTIVFSQAEDVCDQLGKFGITEQVGANYFFDSMQDAVASYHLASDAPTPPLNTS
nr:STAS domain-containing protein [Armatimonadota bacterium]